MKFENKENFRNWLANILDEDSADMVSEFDFFFEEFLKDVEDAVMNGNSCVEVSRDFTRSGVPEEYIFYVEYDENGVATVEF